MSPEVNNTKVDLESDTCIPHIEFYFLPRNPLALKAFD